MQMVITISACEKNEKQIHTKKTYPEGLCFSLFKTLKSIECYLALVCCVWHCSERSFDRTCLMQVKASGYSWIHESSQGVYLY